jgi:hypothetical protein
MNVPRHLHPDPWPESQRRPVPRGEHRLGGSGRHVRPGIIPDAMPAAHYVPGSARALMAGEPTGRARHRVDERQLKTFRRWAADVRTALGGADEVALAAEYRAAGIDPALVAEYRELQLRRYLMIWAPTTGRGAPRA